MRVTIEIETNMLLVGEKRNIVRISTLQFDLESVWRLKTFLQPWAWISGPNKKLAFSVNVILFLLVLASYVKAFISSFSWIKHYIYIHCIFSLFFLLYSMVIHNCMTRQTSLRSSDLKRFTFDVRIYAF